MAAISSPLLETSIAGATGVIISITSSSDIGLDEVDQAATLITNSAHPDANIIWGCTFDDSMNDEMRITVVATGFDSTVKAEPVAGKKAQPVESAVVQTKDVAETEPAVPAPPQFAADTDSKPFWDDGVWADIEDLFKKR